MASEGGREAASLKRLLIENAGRFEFLQAVRLMQKIWPERRPVGGDFDPRREVVHFHSDLSPVFPATEVSDAEPADENHPAGLRVNFMGVATPTSFGALPRRYAEEIRALVREKNFALRDFLDLFNHRMISLFYRARERNLLALAWDRDIDNSYEHTLWGVLGIGTEGLADRLSLSDHVLAGRAGLLAMRPLSASALEGLVRSVFGAPVEVQQFNSVRYEMEPEDRNRIGVANTQLGSDLYLGGEITLVQSKFRVVVGPMDRERYEGFLPHRPGFRELADLVRFAVGEELDFEVQLSLRAEDVPMLRLAEPEPDSPRLGWSTWLGSEERSEPADDALIDPRFNGSRPGGFPTPAAGAMEATR